MNISERIKNNLERAAKFVAANTNQFTASGAALAGISQISMFAAMAQNADPKIVGATIASGLASFGLMAAAGIAKTQFSQFELEQSGFSKSSERSLFNFETGFDIQKIKAREIDNETEFSS